MTSSWHQHKELKTKNAQRLIPIHDTLIKLGLLDYWKDIVSSGEERLFPKLTKTEKSQKYGKSVGKCFCRMLETLDLKDKTKIFHSLRHTFATRCIELGFDVKSLSEILGHASVNITMNRYVHPSMELKKKNMQLLSSLLTVKKDIH